MVGGTKHFYADYESSKIIDNLKRGEISKICNQAIKEHETSNMSMDTIKRKLAVHNENLEMLKVKIQFLEDKKREVIEEQCVFEEDEEKFNKLLLEITKITEIKGELLDKLTKGVRPSLTTIKHYIKKYHIKSNDVWKAWDMLHGKILVEVA